MLAVAFVVGAGALVVRDHGQTRYDALFASIGAAKGLEPELLKAIAHHETGGSFNPSLVNDRNDPGEGRDLGLMQVNEHTARLLKRDVSKLLEPAYNLETAALLLLRLRQELGERWDTFTWIAAYNAGSPAIKRRGIFNLAYVAAVTYHYLGYTLARQLKGVA